MAHPTPSPARPWEPLRPGERVVVRRRLSQAEAARSNKKVTDIIAIVVSADDQRVVLRRDAGSQRAGSDLSAEEVRVAVPDIVAVKRLGPRPVRPKPHA